MTFGNNWKGYVMQLAQKIKPIMKVRTLEIFSFATVITPKTNPIAAKTIATPINNNITIISVVKEMGYNMNNVIKKTKKGRESNDTSDIK